MSASFTGKTIALCGGTSGMGLAIARAIEEAGGTAVVLGRDDEHAAAARTLLRGPVLTGDAADPAASESLIAAALDHSGALHGLVHVAGGSGRAFGDGPLPALTDDGLRRTIELNFHAAVWSNRAAVRAWRDRSAPGSIVNIGSVLARHPAPEHFGTIAYASAKAALEGFSRALAAEEAAHNIRVNLLTPGLIETPMSARAAGRSDILEWVKQKQPLDGGRIGQPEDVTGAALFLLSDAAGFITGQVLAIDGGWSVS